MTAKAVLCLCPPAVMAGTVATVPAVKRAVHHLTARHHAPIFARPAVARGTLRPGADARERVDCDPTPVTVPAVPIVTYAAPIPDEPGGTVPGGGGPSSGAIGTLAGGGIGGGVAPIASSTPAVTPIVTGAVPEPTTWLMLIGGVGAIGLVMRRRRGKSIGKRAVIGTTLWSGGAVAEAGEMAASAAVRSTVAAKTTAAGVAGKALLCVCPAAVMAGSVMTVPPLRQAVHASTAPIETASVTAARPCNGAMTIPVSAAAVDGFPATVATVPAKTL